MISDINTLLGIDSSSFSGNDKYIRYNNGVQICWGKTTYNFTSFVQWGSVYETNNGTTITFPKSFINNDVSISLQCYLPDGSASMGTETTNVTSSGIAGVYAIRPNTNASPGTVKVTYFAIGMWK